jgi:hypothetical protein
MILSLQADAKRKSKRAKKPSGPVVTVLNKDGIEYTPKMTKVNCPKETEKFCSVKAALVAKVKATDETKWERDLYIKDLNPDLAYETQEIKVHALRWKAGNIISVEDDRESEYDVNIDTGEMLKPARPIIYPAAQSIAPAATATAAPTAAAIPEMPAK